MSIKPRLNRFDLTMIVISLVIGMGIFANPSEVAVRAGSTWIFFGAWIFGGLVTLCGALTFAEIGARYPAAGGFYKVFSYCYHPAFAFMINWVLIISNAASVAVVAIIGANYINPVLLPADMQTPLWVKIVALASVLILYILAFFGIKVSARTQNLLTLFKVLAIAVLCTAVFMHDDSHVVVTGIPHSGNLITALGLSLVPIFFTYGGYQQTINFGGDIIEPKTNIPKGIKVGIAVVILLYLSINFAYYKILGLGGLQQTTTLAATMAGVIFGSIGSKVASILMFASVLAYINVNVMANPRVYYAMSEDGILPYIFRKVNPKTQVQEFGVSFFVLSILVILFFADSFRKMLDYVMFFDTIGLSLAALSIFILRKKTKQMDGTGIYTIKWFPWVPIIFILSYWFVTINIFLNNPFASVVCLATFGVGLMIYYASTIDKNIDESELNAIPSEEILIRKRINITSKVLLSFQSLSFLLLFYLIFTFAGYLTTLQNIEWAVVSIYLALFWLFTINVKRKKSNNLSVKNLIIRLAIIIGFAIIPIIVWSALYLRIYIQYNGHIIHP